MLFAVSDRQAEMVDIMPAYLSDVEPALGVLDLPFLMPEDWSKAAEVYDSIRDQAFNPIYDWWNSVEVMTYFFAPMRFHADFPVTSWDSLKGKKIRISGREASKMVAELGGVPVSVPAAEISETLKRGVIDGVVTTTPSAEVNTLRSSDDATLTSEESSPPERLRANDDHIYPQRAIKGLRNSRAARSATSAPFVWLVL